MRRFLLLSSPGLERCLERELQTLRVPGQFERVPGGVAVHGTGESLWRAVLQSRVAEFARVCLGDPFHAADTKTFNACLQRLPWESCLWHGIGEAGSAILTKEHVPALRIEVSSVRSRLYHTGFIEECVRAAVASRSSALVVDEQPAPALDDVHPPPLVHIQLRHDACQVTVSATGPLHQRGYHRPSKELPVRETLAAASVLESPLLRRLAVAAHSNEELVVWDPFCSSGVLLLEALGIALGQLPRAEGKCYPFMRFPCHAQGDYAQFLHNIDITPHPALPRLRLLGTDTSQLHIERAGRNLERFIQQLWRGGVGGGNDDGAIVHSPPAGSVSFELGSPAQAVRQLAGRPTLVLTRLPSARGADQARKRGSAAADVLEAYGQLGRLLRQGKAEWRGVMCLAEARDSDIFRERTGLEWSQELRILDRGVEMELLQWTGRSDASGSSSAAGSSLERDSRSHRRSQDRKGR